MKNVKVIIVVILLFGEAVMPFPGDASIGNLCRCAGQEICELVARKGGKEVLEEGGKVGAEKMSRFFARYGAHGRQAFNLVGDDVIKLASRYGKEGVEMIAAHSVSEARVLLRHADDAVSIWRRFGRQGTTLMVKHPGIAKPLLDVCGKRGLAVAERLSSENLIRFVNLAHRISLDNLDTMITWILAKGDEVMSFLWRNKGAIVGGAAIYSLLKDYEAGFTVTEIGPDGKPVSVHKTHSFIQHWFERVTGHTLGAYPWFPLAALVLLIVIYRFRGGICWRRK